MNTGGSESEKKERQKRIRLLSCERNTQGLAGKGGKRKGMIIKRDPRSLRKKGSKARGETTRHAIAEKGGGGHYTLKDPQKKKQATFAGLSCCREKNSQRRTGKSKEGGKKNGDCVLTEHRHQKKMGSYFGKGKKTRRGGNAGREG